MKYTARHHALDLAAAMALAILGACSAPEMAPPDPPPAVKPMDPIKPVDPIKPPPMPSNLAVLYGKVLDGQGPLVPGLSGTGAISKVRRVRASAVKDDGSMELLGEGEVKMDGSYSVEVPHAKERIVVEALDQDGARVAAALAETSGSMQREQVVVPPMQTETSVEAMVYEKMAQGGAPQNPTGVKDRIDAGAAGAVHEAAALSGSPKDDIQALADGVSAAQSTEVKARKAAGDDISQMTQFAESKPAAGQLNKDLHEGKKPQSTAQEEFRAALDSQAEARGLDATERASIETQVSLSQRLTVEERLGGMTSLLGGPLAERVTLAAADQEARRVALGVTAALVAASAPSGIIDRVRSAGMTLRQQVAAATTVGQARAAFDTYSVTLVGGASVKSSVLGDFLGVNDFSAMGVTQVVMGARDAANQLDGEARTAVQEVLGRAPDLDADALGAAIARAWKDFTDAVNQAASGPLAPYADKIKPSVALLTFSTGSFRAAN